MGSAGAVERRGEICAENAPHSPQNARAASSPIQLSISRSLLPMQTFRDHSNSADPRQTPDRPVRPHTDPRQTPHTRHRPPSPTPVTDPTHTRGRPGTDPRQTLHRPLRGPGTTADGRHGRRACPEGCSRALCAVGPHTVSKLRPLRPYVTLRHRTQRSLWPVGTGHSGPSTARSRDVRPPTHPLPPRLLDAPHTPHAAVCGAREHPSAVGQRSAASRGCRPDSASGRHRSKNGRHPLASRPADRPVKPTDDWLEHEAIISAGGG